MPLPSARPLILALCLAALGCAVSGTPSSEESVSEAVKTPPRDWKKNPAIVELDRADDVYAVSDVHGHYDQFVRLLANNGLVDAPNANPTKVRWTGGGAVLVIVGDLIDKGPRSLETIDLARALQASAPRSGGRVIVTMGNHEAEFLLDPRNSKATSKGEDENGIDNELDREGIGPKSLVRGTDREGRGAWLAGLPFAARVKKWFFAHGGNPSRLSLDDLSAKLQRSLDHHGFADKDITGAESILQAERWYGNPKDDNAGQKDADALGVRHIVFGHDPGALEDRGRIAASDNGILYKIDTAMGIHEASGIGRAMLLHIKFAGGRDVTESLDESGNVEDL